MHRPRAFSRRDLIRLGASAAALPALLGLAHGAEPAPLEKPADPFLGLKIGIATYTFSRLPLDETIKDVKRVGVHYVSIKDAHLPLKSTAEQRKAVVQKFKDAGITPLSCGNIGMKDNESDLRNVFEYARDIGVPTIVCTPIPAALPILDNLVKEFNIRVAIHNHGPEDKLWPSPYTAFDAIQKLDPRIGLCIDVGHTYRAGVDPSEAIQRCAERLYDIHLKDLAGAPGKLHAVEVGRGILDIRKMLTILLDLRYQGLIGLEYEKDMADPLAGVAESLGYVRGVLSGVNAPRPA